MSDPGEALIPDEDFEEEFDDDDNNVDADDNDEQGIATDE